MALVLRCNSASLERKVDAHAASSRRGRASTVALRQQQRLSAPGLLVLLRCRRRRLAVCTQAGLDGLSEPFRAKVKRRSERNRVADAVSDAWRQLSEDPLKRRVLTTIWLLLCIRGAQFVPLPGFQNAPSSAVSAAAGNVVQLLLPAQLTQADLTVNTNVLSVCHMGITPYITSSIAVSFALAAVPELRQWRKDAGAEGTDVISQWGRRIGLACGFLQALWTAWQLRPFAAGSLGEMSLLPYMLCASLPLTAGTSSLMWMAEEITRHGIGQGTSMVISLSCVASYAVAARQLLPALFPAASAAAAATTHVPALVACAALLAVFFQTALAVLITEGVRKVPISFFQLQGGATAGALVSTADGTGSGGGEALRGDHIPLRINPSGIQPVLFAICLLDGVPWALSALNAPQLVQGALAAVLDPGHVVYYALYAAAVFAFSFLDLEDLPTEMAEYLLKCGARIPGVRPGANTAEYLRNQQTSARAWGGAMLALLSVLSQLADKALQRATGVGVGFTGLLIITGTALQCRRQVRALSEKPRLKKTLEML